MDMVTNGDRHLRPY